MLANRGFSRRVVLPQNRCEPEPTPANRAAYHPSEARSVAITLDGLAPVLQTESNSFTKLFLRKWGWAELGLQKPSYYD